MPQIGATTFSFRGSGPWRGMTTKSHSLPSHFTLLENCYVSSDGSEIRSMPGWKTIGDPVSTARTASMTLAQASAIGYERTTIDAVREVRTASGVYFVAVTATERMLVWSRPTHIHAVEQLRGRWVFIGESSDRREPVFNSGRTAFVRVTEYSDNGADITLTINEAYDSTANDFNTIQVNDQIILTGLTGSLAAILNNLHHTVTNLPTATTIRIDTTSGGAVGAVTGQSGFIDRVSYNGTAAGASGLADISDDSEALTAWTSTVAGSVDAALPFEVLHCAFVANRQRDFGDLLNGHKEGNSSGTYGRSRRRQLPIPYRLVPHLAGNRLIAVAPGYSCVFQVPAVVPINYDESDFTFTDSAEGIGWFGNDIYDKPRCLGLPKAVCVEDPDKATGSSYHVTAPGTDSLSFGGNSLNRDGTYQFCFAYKDDATGDVGLTSEPISVTTDGGAGARQGLRFLILFPGYMMHESLGLTINVYRTEKNGNTFYFDRTIPMATFQDAAASTTESAKYGTLPSATANYYYHVQYDAIYQADEQLRLQTGIVPSALEQMPRGAKAGRTIRGFTLFGGSLGDVGSRLELRSGNLSLVYTRGASALDGTNYYYDRVESRGPGLTFTSVDGGYGCSATGIPPAYSGEFLVSKTMMPYPRQFIQLNKLVNVDVGWTGVFPFGASIRDSLTDIRYQILDTPLRAEADIGRLNTPAQLVLPRGRIQISEPDHPGVTPATSQTVIANEYDEDIEGIGDMGGQAVICTRNRTYGLGFAQSPVGVQPEVASDRFGCIAANSMVEFDGGCAWMSDRGPCAMIGGAFRWIGEPLEQFFAGESSRYKRDSRGMMPHSWACHDAERGLIYFGLFADRQIGLSGQVRVSYRGSTARTWDEWTAQSNGDEAKSRFPCDEILVYSYRVDSWSVWRYPAGMEVKWMTRGQDSLGNSRVAFLGVDDRLYAYDDAYSMFNRDAPLTAITSASSGTTINVAGVLGTSITQRGNIDLYAQAGMPVYVFNFTTKQFKGRSTLVSVGGGGTSVVVADAMTVEVGDFLVVGAREFTITTTFNNFKDSETSQMGKIGAGYSLWSRAGFVGGSTPQNAYVLATVSATKRQDDLPAIVPSTRTSTDAVNNHTYLGQNDANETVFNMALALGKSSGTDFQVTLSFIGSAQVRLHDIYGEVA